MARHEGFGKRLTRLELCGGLSWTEQQAACFGKSIADTATERQFGTDDGEIDGFALGDREDRVGAREVYGCRTNKPGSSRIPGCTQNAVRTRFGQDPGDQGVLSGSATHDENSHIINMLRGDETEHWRGEYFVDLAQECA